MHRWIPRSRCMYSVSCTGSLLPLTLYYVEACMWSVARPYRPECQCLDKPFPRSVCPNFSSSRRRKEESFFDDEGSRLSIPFQNRCRGPQEVLACCLSEVRVGLHGCNLLDNKLIEVTCLQHAAPPSLLTTMATVSHIWCCQEE